MEEQVLQSLIEMYKERGVDLSFVVGDPMFAGLPLSAKVQLIKKYAGTLNADSTGKLRSRDYKNLGWNAGLASLGAVASAGLGALSFAGHFKGTPVAAYAKPLMLAAAGGAGLATLKAGFDTYSNLQRTRSLKQRLQALVDNTTDNNAIKYISTGGGVRPAAYASPATEYASKGIDSINNKYLSNLQNNTEHSIWTGNYADTFTPDGSRLREGMTNKDAYNKFYEIAKRHGNNDLKSWDEIHPNQ